MRIARVIVDLSLNREFDYLVPPELDEAVRAGTPVLVPFGKSERRGFVTGFAEASSHGNLKSIKAVAGKKELIDERVMALARWVADYYCAPVETAMRTVLPAAVRKKASAFKEALHVHATAKAADAEAVATLRTKRPKQAAVLDALAAHPDAALADLAEAAGVSTAVIRALERGGFVSVSRGVVRRDPHERFDVVPTKPHELMPQQQAAMDVVIQACDTGEPRVVLLFGVTGSGKTEVYLQAIDHVRAKGKGAIVLVPEIALTPQTVDRFRARFGECVAVLHSELSAGERHDEWHRVHEGKADIVIGPRSAVFAPVRNLGLIIVDEEHEHTYKQEEQPRYNARDVAVVRGRMENCPVILGSATPSLESLYNAHRGKYRLVKMPDRVDHQKMPVMRIVDMREEFGREGQIPLLSRDLVDAIRIRLDRAEQTILFLNRRGYASSLVCKKCGEVAMCPHCSLAMTYHKTHQRLVCHLCGLQQPVPSACPNRECRDPSFRYSGAGTQRVEDVLAKCFPKARVLRMDADTMTRRDAYRTSLNEFRSGRVDILVGTQMIAKGLHFPNVTLVGVINADVGLHMPDFRAGERTFQLLTQVSGRAGRGDIAGEVVVQTFTPFHTAVQAARRLDYDGFYDQEIEFRRELSYPPAFHLVCILVRGVSEERVRFAATAFMKQLEAVLPASALAAGPAPAPIARIRGEHREQIMIRAAATATITGPLKATLASFKWPDDVAWSVDVDAVSLL